MNRKDLAANHANGANGEAAQSSQLSLLSFAFIRVIRGYLLVVLLFCGCSRHAANEVVIYCSVDQMYAEPILKDFEKQTGIHVKAVYDSEAVKSVGLVNRLRAEAKNPQADVFWNNEMARSYQLFQEGVVESPTLFAARVRVLVYNTHLVRTNDIPRSILELTQPKWRGRVAMAYPLFGTTSTHAAALFAALGKKGAEDYFQALKENGVRLFEGNSVACEQVAQGQCWVGLTDTDDFWERKSQGLPIELVYPDQSESVSQVARFNADDVPKRGRGSASASSSEASNASALGCCVIPNTVSLVRHAPHPDFGWKLFRYLASDQVEQKLAFGPARQIPMLSNATPVPEGMNRLSDLKLMPVDATSVAEELPTAIAFLENLFAR